MKPFSKTLTVVVDPNGICVDQQIVGAGDLALDGALISDGAYTSTTAQQIGLESAGNLSGIDFTFTGTGYDSNGFYQASLAEVVTGPNANTVETTAYFLTITSIAADAAVGTDIEIGPVDQAVSQVFPMSQYSEFNIGMQVAFLAGSPNISVQFTLDDIFDQTLTIGWLAPTALSGITSSASTNLSAGVSAVRLIVNSGTDADSIRLNVNQP